jgi:hypothetical protein
MIRAIDAALAALEGSGEKGIERVEDLFEGFNPSQYDEEAYNRWGASATYVEGMKRTRHYTRLSSDGFTGLVQMRLAPLE